MHVMQEQPGPDMSDKESQALLEDQHEQRGQRLYAEQQTLPGRAAGLSSHYPEGLSDSDSPGSSPPLVSKPAAG